MLEEGDVAVSHVSNLNVSYNESAIEEGGTYSEQEQSQNNELSKIDQSKSQEQFKFLGLTWNLEIIKQKGFHHPKFIIIYALISSVILIVINVVMFGYGTNWNLLVFFPTFIGLITTIIHILHDLGLTPEQRKLKMKSIIYVIYITISSIIGFGGLLCAIIIKTPFNYTTFFLTGLYPMMFFNSLLTSLTLDESVVPSWLPQKKEKIFPIQKFRNQQKSKSFSMQTSNKNILQIKKEELKIYKKMFWASLTSSTLFIDVISDIYFAVDLIIFCGKSSKLLLLIGILLCFCCLADLILVCIMQIFPAWVSFSAHSIALTMEIPNVVLTAISLWEVNKMDHLSMDQDMFRSLAIFSLITTILNTLIHITYLAEYWAVKNAVELIQQY